MVFTKVVKFQEVCNSSKRAYACKPIKIQTNKDILECCNVHKTIETYNPT